MAIHQNGLAVSAHLVGASARVINGRPLRGPGFTAITRGQRGNVEVDISGPAAPEQVLRLLRAEDALVPSSGDGRIDITIATTAGADHYVFSEDMRHRLLFSRTWHRPGISGVFYGLNPILSDMEGPLDKVPARSSLRNIVGVLQSRGSVRCVSVLNLFTLRTSKARDLDMTIGRFAGSADEDAVLAAADIVIPAWGGGVKAQHMAAVYELLRHLVELGRPPMLRAKGGHILTTTMSPAQPLHARLGGYQGVTLVPAPQAWIEGGALVPSSSAVTMHPISQAAVSPPGVGARGKGDRTEVEIGGSPAELRRATWLVTPICPPTCRTCSGRRTPR